MILKRKNSILTIENVWFYTRYYFLCCFFWQCVSWSIIQFTRFSYSLKNLIFVQLLRQLRAKSRKSKQSNKNLDFVLKSAEFRQNQRSAHRLENAVLSPTFQSVLYVKADLFSWKQALPELCAFVWVCVSLCVWAVVFGRQGVSKQRKNLSEEVDLEPDCWGGATNNDSLCFCVLYTCAGSARVSLCTCSADGKVVDYVTLERVMQCSVSLASKRSHPSFLFFSFFSFTAPPP